jgi:hypothetical protein
VASPYSPPSSLQIELGEINWKTYADGFPNIFVEGAEHIRGKHVVGAVCKLNSSS